MARAQSTVEYALLIATVALLALMSGVFYGQAIYAWLVDVFARIVVVP